MALIQVRFYSEVLGMSRSMDVILPQKSNGIGQISYSKEGGKDIPILYLLHGGSDDHTTWQRRTSIERYALSKGLAVVMPSTDMGCYTDMKYGYDFFEFYGNELPCILHEFFPNLTRKREKTFVAGQSMGGYGALKLGTMYPERFSNVGCLSSMIDPKYLFRRDETPDFAVNIFGSEEEIKDSINDTYYIMDKLIASEKEKPKYYMICGTEDFLYQENVMFRDTYMSQLDMQYEEEAGEHEWGFWDRNIQKILNWLPLN